MKSAKASMGGEGVTKPDAEGLLRILHLEDSAADSELVARAIAKQGARADILVVTDEAQYLRAIKSAHLDVILSDYTLPTFDGLKALKFAQQLRPDLPFLFVSGTIGEERAIECLRAGAADYVLKDRLVRLFPAIGKAVQAARREAERSRALEALRESEERFRQVMENIEEAFWLAEVTPRRVVYISPAYERIWHRSCEELLAQPTSWLESVHPADRERVVAAVARQASVNYNIEYRIVRPDGSVRWINDRAFPIRDGAGNVYRLAGVALDITARRELEETVAQSNKMDALGQFAGGIAHDFNNVLAVVQMQAALLLDGRELPPKLRPGLENIIAAAVRAANLTRQLLTFSRREMTQARDIDLVEIVGGMTKLLQRITGENIDFQTCFAADMPAVHADPSMVEQVLMNLVVNARDAMPNGGRLVVSVEAALAGAARVAPHAGVKPGPFLCLGVADTGTGIPPEVLPRIFEPFFTTKEAGCGTGLGLATVFRIVKQHHGWIEVVSEPGKGATFRVFLPALDHAAAKGESRSAAGPRGRDERILLVEDDDAVRTIARAVLEEFGYRVSESATGTGALQLWEEQGGNFDLLVTDLILPGMAGSELGQRLTAAKPNLQVIYTSGYSNDIVARYLSVDAGRALLQKPYSVDQLVSLVRSRLDERPGTPHSDS